MKTEAEIRVMPPPAKTHLEPPQLEPPSWQRPGGTPPPRASESP